MVGSEGEHSDLIKSSFEVSVSEENTSLIIRVVTRIQVTLADQQGDPNSPLYSIKTFEQLGL